MALGYFSNYFFKLLIGYTSAIITQTNTLIIKILFIKLIDLKLYIQCTKCFIKSMFLYVVV